MKKLPAFEAITALFPWTKVETDGSVNHGFILARYDILVSTFETVGVPAWRRRIARLGPLVERSCLGRSRLRRSRSAVALSAAERAEGMVPRREQDDPKDPL